MHVAEREERIEVASIGDTMLTSRLIESASLTLSWVRVRVRWRVRVGVEAHREHLAAALLELLDRVSIRHQSVGVGVGAGMGVDSP